MSQNNRFKYNNQYAKDNYDRISVFVPKGTREKWKAIAAERGQSLNTLVVEAVNTYLKDLWFY